MCRYSYTLLLSLCLISCNQKQADLTQINEVLDHQLQSWNDGDLDGYMEGYWKDENLVFTGGKSLNKGWENTLAMYKRSYPSKDKMGILSFNELEVELLSVESAFATGEWRLIRVSDTLQGRFTLVWRKLNEKWCIIADHSS